MTDVICKTCVQTFRSDETHNCPGLAMTTPSDNLLERVAEAICDSMHKSEPRWPTLSDEVREHWRVYARAAIEASNDLVGEMDWLASNTNLELTWGELGGDMSDCAWRVHRVNGGYNDREWTLIATGETPIAAIKQARMRDARGGGAVVQENSGRTQIGEWPEE